MKPFRGFRWLGPSLWAAVVLVLAPSVRGGEPILKGYADYETYRKQLESIAGSRFASLRSLGRTLGGREVYLLEIGVGNRDEKPAILVVGGVHPPHLMGSELAVRLARRLVDQAATDKTVAAMLERVTFYFIPRPSPDPCEAFFRPPYWERAANERKIDDDRDGLVDEDGPDDLNGDGLITMMRVEDPAGTYMPHPKDPRVLIPADREKNQRGRWLVYSEGIDNDKDGDFNEDPPGGTELNRNFAFRYPYFQRGAGPHQVSEVETRAVADFCFNHTNIAVVLSFTLEDNLLRPWKPNPAAESQRIKTSLLGADAPYFDYVAEQYRDIHGAKDAPESPAGQGSFSEWAYFHFGRWSFACRGWWIPQVGPPDAKTEPKPGERPGEPKPAGKPAESKAATPLLAGLPGEPLAENTGSYGPEDAKPDTKPASGKPEAKGRMGRGRKPPVAAGERKPEEPKADPKQPADDLNALRWFAEKKIDGFVDWKPIQHPDFPGRKVEVGGFKPLVRLNPPAEELEPLAERHWRFLRRLVELLPDLSIEEVNTEPLGEGVWRVTALVVNRGYLPTVSEMGRLTNEPLLLQAAIDLPQGVSLVTGHPRVQLPALAGNGGKAEPRWLVRTEPGKEAVLTLRAWCASVGSVTRPVKLPAAVH